MKPHLETESVKPHLHASLTKLLPSAELEQFDKLCSQKACKTFPPLNLSKCSLANTILSPAIDHPHENSSLDKHLPACDTSERKRPTESVVHIRANLIGRLTSNRDGALRIQDSTTAVPLVIAPPPPPSIRNTYIYATNWRYIPRRAATPPYFEVLYSDIVVLTPVHRTRYTVTPNPSPLVCLRATISAKSCRIATRSSCCFLIELSGASHATVVVFRDDAVAWWPFLRVGLDVSVSGLRLCSLPSYSRRTVLLASTSTVVLEVEDDRPMRNDGLPLSKRPRVSKPISTDKGVVKTPPLGERAVDYEGIITDVLPDGRFKLDARVTFHPGPVHSFGSDMNVSSNLRKGTKIKVYNAHLVRRDCDARLFPTAKSSIEVLYFGELNTIQSLNDVLSWRQSGWDRLWKQLDHEHVLWAEEMYDALATKFWHWLRGTTQPAEEVTDRDRISCLLGEQNEVGLVQYVLHLLSGQEELLNQDSSSRRDIYKEFLDPPVSRDNMSNMSFPTVPTLKRLREKVLASQVNRENNNTEPSMNRVDITSVQHDVIMLHHSDIMTSKKRFSGGKTKGSQRDLSLALSGLLHALESEHDRLAISDDTATIPIRIVGLLEPALIGSVILVTDYYMVLDFRAGEHEAVTAMFTASSVKTIVDGPYAEMGNSATSGPLVCETQSHSRAKKSTANRLARKGGFSEGSISLTRKAWIQSASGQPSQEGSLRIADVPLICMFVREVRVRNNRIELGGKLIALRNQRDDVWEIILRDQEARIFWDCKLVFFGDAAMALAPVFQENRLWSVSCAELSGEPDASSYIWNKGSADAGLTVTLSSTFNRITPWVQDLAKGEYMRYVCDDISNGCGIDNLSVMSGEGKQYSLVRDAVERWSARAMGRITSELWILYNGREREVHIRGTVTRNSIWDKRASGNVAEWVVTIRDDELDLFAVPIDFRDRSECIIGLAPGMRVVVYNIQRVRPEPWERFRFVAGVDTVVRVVSIREDGCCSSRRGDEELMKRVPRVDLVDLKERWVGMVRFDVVQVVEVRLCRRRRCGCGRCVKDVEMGVTVMIEDGTTRGRMRSEGFDRCCELLGLSAGHRANVMQTARAHGRLTIDAGSASEFGVGEVFMKKFGWHSFTGVVVCDHAYVGEEVTVKCFNLGFGQRLWTAAPENLLALECVALLRGGVESLRARVYAIEDGRDA